MVTGNTFIQAFFKKIVEALHFNIIFFPGPSPGCPAPDVTYFRKVIRTPAPPLAILKIDAIDVHYGINVLIFFQQIITIRKERQGRQAVVFQYNALLFVLKEPGDCRTNAQFASQVIFPHQFLYLAGPVHGIKHLYCAANIYFICFIIRPGTIYCNIEFLRLCFPYLLKNFQCMTRPVEGDH